MAKNQGPNGERKSQVVRDLPAACASELAAVEFLEAQRWGGSTTCPHCTSGNVYKMTDRKTGQRSARFLWRCKGCSKQFTVRVGTVFEDSKIPLRHWAHAFARACASKKGISAKQIQRETGLSYESALFMLHRIRFAMADAGPLPKLDGILECDETYVGGKPRHQGTGHATRADRKTAVFALVQRGGQVRAMTLAKVDAATLHSAIREHGAPSAQIVTDELGSYSGIGGRFAGGHQTVKHSAREYARGNIHTNSVEGFFSLLKRGMYGTFHSVSKAHLHRYVSEFAYRFNTRKLDDGARITLAIRKSQGKRLLYKKPA
ncbi:MAG: IS1595 family transposase [Planctomycetota bacterium]